MKFLIGLAAIAPGVALGIMQFYGSMPLWLGPLRGLVAIVLGVLAWGIAALLVMFLVAVVIGVGDAVLKAFNGESKAAEPEPEPEPEPELKIGFWSRGNGL